MKVKVIPVLEDNYMYLIIEEHTREAVAVDVAVPKRLLEITAREEVSLTTVLTTHHHWDHTRGNAELAHLRPGLEVMGADERICALTRRLSHGEELRFGAIHVRCLLTPGHTTGHMSYFLWEDECPDPPALFSGTLQPGFIHLCNSTVPSLPPSDPFSSLGDALSVAGCGWHLEDTAQQMYQSLAKILGTLPPQTKVFCGHEHTLSNLEFAQKVEPCNNHVQAKLSWAQKRDDDDIPTVPSTLGEELLYNPFLRVTEDPVREFTGQVAPAQVLEVLCRERARFQLALEPLQPQVRALLALQWGLLSTPQEK
ncbi:hydroxyacylglutathione hydrolase-like protein isoform X1 [Cricetulus griseus]|uniref:Hydroxyacylglutathione hydrolase-like protein isoform X1 n=1 Tax=Cricetulus griseus TaxID=10029 RepID=A0A9J7H274_CRIGR|nr:hydroxyacylglutathione hydrolase-like protein isoform X1 [Cricetulus griseus]XP_035303296.1 hydroxyacylglutathione hydrolase-like protein isoform X1 [Cricetulus griseus]XP_035303297.1 hydroxyacylglutathione hydrolase-like protein isoform X1 [Cricetulus griseus]XP_035311130.1 hydroxyacylglutathione hydrolase-like protein isoform X1 [Cricetulus griseus]